MFDDDFGGYDDFNEYGDWDAMQCAEGDYNAWEEEQVFLDGVAEREAIAREALREDIAFEVARAAGRQVPTPVDWEAADRILELTEGQF